MLLYTTAAHLSSLFSRLHKLQPIPLRKAVSPPPKAVHITPPNGGYLSRPQVASLAHASAHISETSNSAVHALSPLCLSALPPSAGGAFVSTAPDAPLRERGCGVCRRGEPACTLKSPLPCDAPRCTHPPFARSATSFAPQGATSFAPQGATSFARKVQHHLPVRCNIICP